MESAGGRLVAVTGASGFIGGAVARHLLDAGWRVRTLIRDASRAKTLERLGAEATLGDITDKPSLVPFVRGAYAIVHCAGTVRGCNRSDFDPVNVQGVANVAQAAAREASVSRVIALSSLAAREPELSPYAASKHDGELALAAAAGGLEWVALRPPAVYGPGDRELLPLFRLMLRGIAPILGPAEARFSLLYVDDLAAAVQRFLCREDGEGVFEIHDGRPGGYSWDEVVSIAQTLRQAGILRVPISPVLLRGLARLSVFGARLIGRAPMLSPGKTRELTHPDWVCDNDAVGRAFGWSPRVDFAEGLRRTLEVANSW